MQVPTNIWRVANRRPPRAGEPEALLDGGGYDLASGTRAVPNAFGRAAVPEPHARDAMTISPDTPRLAFSDLADAVLALRERGLRLTTPRRLVLEALFAAEGPVSAEHLAHGLNVDVTSVYRNLETLEQHGLARHVHLGHGPGLYVLVGRGEPEFLSCERCGAVRTLTPEQLDPVREQIKERFGYQARFTHFPIVGLCPACLTHSQSENRRKRSGADVGKAGDHQRHDEHSHGDHVHSHPYTHDPGQRHEHDHHA
jgi:Fur family transcriptional regulator, ferric uptake regulator